HSGQACRRIFALARRLLCRFSGLCLLLPVMVVPTLALAQSGGELAKAAQNPIASLISVPFQNNTYFGYGPDNQTQNVLNVPPVAPFSIGDGLNIVTRTIIPLAYTPWPQSMFGLGDVQPQIYLVPPS